ncbi:MAG TPA: DNA repair protein RecO [Phycisphaerae bacterium]|nr:DNA repair protein RecO [Phycisphaerae bacterium]
MSLFSDIAVVLRRLDYSETSQVLVLLTREHGQQRIIAKGVKRATKTRASVGIDLLEVGRLVFSRRPGKEETLATLTEWRQEETFPHLRTDLVRNYAAQYAAEVTSHLMEVHDPHPELFDGLRKFFRALKDGPAIGLLARYLWFMLTQIGLRPELSRCMGCGRSVEKDATVYFSSHQGGAICRDCEPAIVEKRRMSVALARALGVIGSPHPLDDTKLAREAFDLLDYHLTELLARPPKLSGPLRAALK